MLFLEIIATPTLGTTGLNQYLRVKIKVMKASNQWIQESSSNFISWPSNMEYINNDTSKTNW